MFRRWLSSLVALFVLLWAKLPGPSPVDASPGFQVKRKGTTENECLVSALNTSELLVSSETVGITLQKVKQEQNGWSLVDTDILYSPIKVTMLALSPLQAEVDISKTNVRDALTNSIGQYAIVTGIDRDGKLTRQHSIIAESKGSGVWTILKGLGPK